MFVILTTSLPFGQYTNWEEKRCWRDNTTQGRGFMNVNINCILYRSTTNKKIIILKTSYSFIDDVK